MRLTLCVVGRLRNGPEKDLFSDYIDRFEKTGRGMGLGPVEVIEVEDRKGGGRTAEGDLLLRAIPKGAVILAMDERGKTMASRGSWPSGVTTARRRSQSSSAEPTVCRRSCGSRRTCPCLSARWSGHICWRASCWPNNCTALPLF